MASVSTRRTKAEAGWCDPTKLKIGPNGRALCRWCGCEVPKGRRRTFCSKECVHEWRLRTDPGYVRRCVYERDRGVCAKCGLDTMKDGGWHTGNLWEADHITPVVEGGGECGLDGYRTLCVTCHKLETAALARRRAEQRKSAGPQIQLALQGQA